MTKTTPIPSKSRNFKPTTNRYVAPGIRSLLQVVGALQGAQALTPENQEIFLKALIPLLPNMDDEHTQRATRWMKEWADWLESEEYKERSKKFADRVRLSNARRKIV